MANGQSPNAEGTDINTAADQIAGLLDDDGQFNPNPDQVSRAHPDYDESEDSRADNTQGRDDRGRFTKKAAADEELDESLAGDESDDELSDEEIDDTVDDTDEEDVEAADDDSAQGDEEETGDAIETLQQFAEALEVPVEDLLAQITHTFRAADEDVTVNLSELVGGYQKDADYRKGTSKLAEDRRTAELDYANRMAEYEQQNQALAAQMDYMQNYFMQQLNAPQLEQMRLTDPAEWTARRSELTEQLQQLQGVRQQAATGYQAFKTQQLQELRNRETARISEKITDFGENHKSRAKEVMRSIGFGDDEVGQIFDHRVISAALELHDLRSEVAALREEKAKAADTVKRVKKNVPKFTQKPGKAASTKKGVNRDAVSKLRRRAKQSGKVEDAARIIETML